MDKKTVNKLNQLNKEFYLKTQKYFNITRQYYWQGWEKLLFHLQGRTLKVLDLGCGNGRLGKWLLDRGKQISYTGIDSNQYLLSQAKKDLPKAKLIKQDLLKPWGIKDKFDLIVLMAVLHHLPGKTKRLKSLQKAGQLLAKNGLLVFTVWHFNKLKRFQNQVVKKLPDNDYILNWKKGVTAERYIHLFDDREIDWLIKKLKLKLVADFVSDGKQGQGNRYVVLKMI